MSRLNTLDNLNRRATQLKALLLVASSDHFTSELAEGLRADYLWACSDLAEGIYADLMNMDVLEVQE